MRYAIYPAESRAGLDSAELVAGRARLIQVGTEADPTFGFHPDIPLLPPLSVSPFSGFTR